MGHGGALQGVISFIGHQSTSGHGRLSWQTGRNRAQFTVLRSRSWSLQTDSTSLDPSLNIFSHHWALSILMCFGKKLCFHEQGSWCARSCEYSQWAQHDRVLLHLSLTLCELGRVIRTQKQSHGKLGAGDLLYSQFLQVHAVRRLVSWCFSSALLFPTPGKLHSSKEG